jgi:hypothetical protein
MIDKEILMADDIVLSKGPVVSPEWMNKFIFPRYEEFCGTRISVVMRRALIVREFNHRGTKLIYHFLSVFVVDFEFSNVFFIFS